MVCVGVQRGMYQRKVDVDMMNAAKIKLADVSSVSPSSEQSSHVRRAQAQEGTYSFLCLRMHLRRYIARENQDNAGTRENEVFSNLLGGVHLLAPEQHDKTPQGAAPSSL